MVLVRKVGQPTAAPIPFEDNGKKLLHDASRRIRELEQEKRALASDLEKERAAPPEVVVKERIVEVEKPVTPTNVMLALSQLEEENALIRDSLKHLDRKTASAIGDAARRIEDLEEEAAEARERLRAVAALTQGRWPFMRKKTLRRTLEVGA